MNSDFKMQNSDVIIYTNKEGNVKVEVVYDNEMLWLNQTQISELFGKSVSTINEHIKNIYSDEELYEEDTMIKFGNSEFAKKPTNYYNLDMIISVGYRVNSKVGIAFRRWATEILKSYMIQGFALDDERFMKGKKADLEYFQRLLERIKLIRTSERMFYQKITDIFAECSIDI